MREVLIIITGIMMVIFIMVYVASEAHFKGWNECYEKMREIDDSYIESANAYISALEQQVKNYERYVQILGKMYEFEVIGNEYDEYEDEVKTNE